jgi:hypothetical protein
MFELSFNFEKSVPHHFDLPNFEFPYLPFSKDHYHSPQHREVAETIDVYLPLLFVSSTTSRTHQYAHLFEHCGLIA